MRPFDECPVKGQNPQYPLLPFLFTTFPVTPDQRGSQSSLDQIPPLPPLSALPALPLPLWAAHWDPPPKEGTGQSEWGGGPQPAFVGTPLLEMEAAGLHAVRCPSPSMGLGCYC